MNTDAFGHPAMGSFRQGVPQTDGFGRPAAGALRHPTALSDEWARLHVRATVSPTATERPIVELAHAVTILAILHGQDMVLREGIVKAAQGLRVLLNGDLGRLDGGTLDQLVSDAMIRCGFDPDIEEFVDRCEG